MLEGENLDQWYYDFSYADYDSMGIIFFNVKWYNEFSFVFAVEDYWQVFVYHFNNAIEASVPERRRPTVKRNNNKKSYRKSIKQMLSRKSFCRKRRRYIREPSHYLAYKTYSVKCTRTTKAIQAHYQ